MASIDYLVSLQMKVLQARAFSGPNFFAPSALACLSVEIVGPRTWPSGEAGRTSAAALLQLLPGLADHPGQQNQHNGFADELRTAAEDTAAGLPLGYIVARVATELQRRHDDGIQPAGLRYNTDRQIAHIYFCYDDPEVALLAGRAAIAIVLSLLPSNARPASDLPATANPEQLLFSFLKKAKALALDQTAIAMIREAKRRDIPWFALDRARRVVQFGQGRHLRRIRETVTDATPYISGMLYRDKTSTNKLLASVYLPVPRQVSVGSAEAAVAATKQLACPVVVKPADSSKGSGVSLQPDGDDAVRAAYALARRHSQHVIVESFVAGSDYRVLVANNKILAAALRLPGAVTGDGRSTVVQLVAELNKDPRRGSGFSRLMNRIEFDEQAESMLNRRGYSKDSVPPAGDVVYLRGTANISTGGTAIDVTDSIHPENRTMLERVARVAGLDVAGIDFITPDIGRSYREVGGAICELNASPGLRPHQIATGQPRDVVGPIVDNLFPNKRNGRIPIAAITGTNGKTTTSRMLAHILHLAGADIGVDVVGLATTDNVCIGGEVVAKGDFAGASGAKILLRDPSVEAAVLETSRGGIAKSGMAYDWCDVGAVLNISTDHIGIDGIKTLEDMARLKGRVVEATRRLAVLNADDPHCLALAVLRRPEQVCLFSTKKLCPLLRGHLSNGGLAMSLEESSETSDIVLHTSAESEVVTPVRAIPATLEGTARHNIQNAMAAAGLAYGLGISTKSIAEALSSFKSDNLCNPGRLNIYEGHPFKVVFDRAHNPDGVSHICDTLRHIPASGRRICVLTGVGTRHAEHIDQIAEIIAGKFDLFICSRYLSVNPANAILLGFPPSEIPDRLAAALIAKGVESGNVLTAAQDREALDKGLDIAEAGDLLVIFSGTPDWCWNRIVTYRRE